MVEQNIVSKLIIMSINTAPIRIDIMFPSFYNKESGFSGGSGGRLEMVSRQAQTCLLQQGSATLCILHQPANLCPS